MACDFEVFFNMNQYDASTEAALAAFRLIDELECKLSYYLDESEISQLNRSHGHIHIATTELREVLEKAQSIFSATAGAFDITSTPLSEVWGFHQRQGAIPSNEQIEAALKHVDATKIEIADEGIRLTSENLKINLNSIGKGYALDRAAALIAGFQVRDFVIHGGQSSVTARGTESRDEHAPDGNSPGWKIGLSHPYIPNHRLAEITLKNQSLSTSGTARQGFFHQGKRYGHVIDPRTGWPTDHFLSATVICQSAATSDALATAFFVMNLDEIQTYCKSHPEIAAILVVPQSKTGSTSIETFNLNEESLRLF